jgi:hypothetical protein
VTSVSLKSDRGNIRETKVISMTDPLTAHHMAISSQAMTNSRRLLWTLTAAIGAGSVGLALAAYFGVSSAEKLLAEYGIWLIVGPPVLLVFSISKTLEERASAKRREPITLIPNEKMSTWSQSKQPSGELHAVLSLGFQVTNVSDGDIKLSAVRLSRPWINRRRFVETVFLIRHPTQNLYSFENPVLAHQATYASVVFVISGSIGRAGNSLRVKLRIQDHATRWYSVSFPMVRYFGPYERNALHADLGSRRGTDMPRSREEWEAEFEKLGPGVVQRNLENKVYLQGEVGGWARAWLARVREASQTEQNQIARSAKKAAWIAAIAAIVAATIAIIAAVIAWVAWMWPHSP